ncbi:MAG TPA: hypothetical protein VGR28_00355 [Candidatus Thermoplasmatota archaeon]|nr:hypothetical protein [Candidatus Thermoplasmatota archaeon]
MARFRDYDGMARLALAGALASTAALFLPWVSIRQGLGFSASFNGFDLLVAPAIVHTTQTPGTLVVSIVVALAGGLAVLGALGGFLVAAEPGLRRAGALNPRAGRALAIAGLAGALVALAVMALLVAPALGPTSLELGAPLGVLGFVLSAVGWPRAHLLGEPEAAPPQGPATDAP